MAESGPTADERRAGTVPEWFAHEPARLLAFAEGAAHPEGGFAWLDDTGAPELDRPVETWITGRLTHVFALATLQGEPALRPMVQHGVAALTDRLRDDRYGGWFAAVDGHAPALTDKRAYDHAFVVLAAASATAAGALGATSLLDEALRTVDERFWRQADGMLVDVWDRSWDTLEPYRGVNANMHAVEAFLATADVTGDRQWADRAARITERVVHGFAREHKWRLPEHFDPHWQVLLDYNRGQRAHPFRPYGVTIGHLLEWARLALHVRHALGSAAPGWLLDDARCLFDSAVQAGWAVDGADGFVYTVDFDDRPVVHDRMHWVVTEAIAAAWVLYEATGQEAYGAWFSRWCEHARACFVDLQGGSWHHQLDHTNRPTSSVWEGKPDVYHAYQASLLPRLTPMSSFVGALTPATDQ